MGNQIVVGHNGEGGGDDALALGLDLANARRGPVDVVAVSCYPSFPSGSGYSARPAGYERELRDEAQQRIAGARTSFRGRLGVSFVVRGGPSPAQVLHALARESSAAAVVVGRSHAKPLGRLFRGSVTEQVLHGAPCPVAVAPVGYAAHRRAPHTIGVAYDGGEQARHALELAADLARHSGARLRLIRALEIEPYWYGGMVGPYPLTQMRRDVEADLDEVRRRLRGIEVDVQVVPGRPHAVLAEQTGLDLLVVGSRGFGPLESVVLGSSSVQLVRQATFPLLVVPLVAPARSAR